MQTIQVIHPIAPVWNSESRILILGTMPSPKSREAHFYYMHPQNRFWRVLERVFGEEIGNTIEEKKAFLLKKNIALWDVLKSCDISGASDASIKNATANDFSPLFESAKIQRVVCTGKTAFALWQKHCAPLYEAQFGVESSCLPSTSPANAKCSLEMLISAYRAALRKTEPSLSPRPQ